MGGGRGREVVRWVWGDKVTSTGTEEYKNIFTEGVGGGGGDCCVVYTVIKLFCSFIPLIVTFIGRLEKYVRLSL